jgi:hypothetical protein
MDSKESPRKKRGNVRISAHYEGMTQKEIDDLTDTLASLIISHLKKEDKE